MRLASLKTLYIDWSGVVSNDMLAVYEASCRLRRQFNLPIVSRAEWLQKCLGAANVRDEFRKAGVALTDDQIFAAYEDTYAAVKEDGIVPTMYPDAYEFLAETARHHRIIVVSAHPHAELKNEIEMYGVEEFISIAAGSVRNKPLRLQTMHRLARHARHEAAYAGDMSADVQAATLAGMLSIAVSTGYHPHELLKAARPDLLVSSLTQLRGHMRR